VHETISMAKEFKSAVISKHQGTDSLCKESMSIFYQCYGAEAGLAGLKWLPYGGLYLTGGLTPRGIDHLQDAEGVFLKAFHDKGRVSSALKNIPVFGVLVDDLGERGAHYIAARELMRKN
jgi:glucokinase